jgi:hypothetical protein
MRRALLSNVLGHLDALEAALRNVDLRNDRGAGIEEILFLGNVVGPGPKPKECLDLAKSRGTKVLAGRQERAVVRKATQPGWAINAATGYPEPGAREGVLGTIHQLFGDSTRVQADDAPTRDFLLDVRSPDYETRLAKEIGDKLRKIPELKGAPLERVLTDVVGRGLVLKFIHRTRVRREGEEALAWLKELPATLEVDGLHLSETFPAGDVSQGSYAILNEGRTRLVRVRA